MRKKAFGMGVGNGGGKCDGGADSCSGLLVKCCKPAADIFLDNYSRLLSDKP